MSNRFWTNKTDGVDDIVAEDFNSAFDSIVADMDKKADKQTANGGFEGGNGASATSGGAIGSNATTQEGAAVGIFATSTDGGAIGFGASTSDGFAGGRNARTLDSVNPTLMIDAIQLGTGTNNTPKSLQVYNYQLMDASGNIPVERLTKLKKLSVPHTTASGYPISLTDHLEGERVIDYKVYGNSVQDGTPTPDTPIEIRSVGNLVTDTSSPYYGKYDVPVTVCGKNILTYPYKDATKTIAGITFTDNGDGTITANGTATAAATYQFYNMGSAETKRIYISSTVTLSGCPTGGGASSYKMGIDIYDEDGNHQYYLDYGDGCTITKTGKSSVCYIVIPTGMTVSNLVFKPQLEFGSTATPYEPYQAPITKHIYLDEPLRKVGDYADYVDYENQRVVRQIEVLDSTGTKIIDESFGLLATPTTEPITVPELVVPQSGTMNISATTSIKPSKLDLTYYQDINKVITELKNAILAQGGNV